MDYFLAIGIFSLPALLVGLFVRHWWAVLLTIGVYISFCLVYPHLYSASYSNSSDFNSATQYSIVVLGLWGLPAVAAACLGVAVRLLVRWLALDRPTPPPVRDWPQFLTRPLDWFEEERGIAKDAALQRTPRTLTDGPKRSGRGR